MDQDQVRPGLLQDLLHAQQGPAGNGGQSLLGLHDVQVVVGLYPEDVQDAVQHLPVLGGNAAEAFNAGTGGQLLYQRAHFDGLRTGAEDAHDTHVFHVCSLSP